MSHALHHLLSFAIEATPRGEKVAVTLRVSDRIGMDAEKSISLNRRKVPPLLGRQSSLTTLFTSSNFSRSVSRVLVTSNWTQTRLKPGVTTKSQLSYVNKRMNLRDLSENIQSHLGVSEKDSNKPKDIAALKSSCWGRGLRRVNRIGVTSERPSVATKERGKGSDKFLVVEIFYEGKGIAKVGRRWVGWLWLYVL